MIHDPALVDSDEQPVTVLCNFGFRNAIEMYMLKGHEKFKGESKQDAWKIMSGTIPTNDDYRLQNGFSPADLFPYFDTEDHHGLILTYNNKDSGKVHWYVINLRAGAMMSTDIGNLGIKQGIIPDKSSNRDSLLDAPPYLPKNPKVSAAVHILYRLFNKLHPGSVDMNAPDYKLLEKLQVDPYDDDMIKSLLVPYSCELTSNEMLEFCDVKTKPFKKPKGFYYHMAEKPFNTIGFSVRKVSGTKTEAADVTEYLEQHLLKMQLTTAMKTILSEKPSDPMGRLIGILEESRRNDFVFTLDDAYKSSFTERVLANRRARGLEEPWENEPN